MQLVSFQTERIICGHHIDMSGFVDLYQSHVPLLCLCINLVSAYKHPNIHHAPGDFMLVNLVTPVQVQQFYFTLCKVIKTSVIFNCLLQALMQHVLV